MREGLIHVFLEVSRQIFELTFDDPPFGTLGLDDPKRSSCFMTFLKYRPHKPLAVRDLQIDLSGIFEAIAELASPQPDYCLSPVTRQGGKSAVEWLAGIEQPQNHAAIRKWLAWYWTFRGKDGDTPLLQLRLRTLNVA